MTKQKKTTGRAKPMANKISMTKDRRRRYGCGGKIKVGKK